MEKNQIRMIGDDKLKSFLKQTNLLYGEKLYLKRRKIERNIELILVSEYPNHNLLTNEIYNIKYDKLLKKIVKSIGMKINHNTILFTVLEKNPEIVRSPLKKEVDKFKIKLESFIKSNKPKIILGFGKIVGKSLIDDFISLDEMRLMKYRFKGIPVKITYDPINVLKNTDLKIPLWNDLKLVRDILTSGNSYG